MVVVGGGSTIKSSAGIDLDLDDLWDEGIESILGNVAEAVFETVSALVWMAAMTLAMCAMNLVAACCRHSLRIMQ